MPTGGREVTLGHLGSGHVMSNLGRVSDDMNAQVVNLDAQRTDARVPDQMEGYQETNA